MLPHMCTMAAASKRALAYGTIRIIQKHGFAKRRPVLVFHACAELKVC